MFCFPEPTVCLSLRNRLAVKALSVILVAILVSTSSICWSKSLLVDGRKQNFLELDSPKSGKDQSEVCTVMDVLHHYVFAESSLGWIAVSLEGGCPIDESGYKGKRVDGIFFHTKDYVRAVFVTFPERVRLTFCDVAQEEFDVMSLPVDAFEFVGFESYRVVEGVESLNNRDSIPGKLLDSTVGSCIVDDVRMTATALKNLASEEISYCLQAYRNRVLRHDLIGASVFEVVERLDFSSSKLKILNWDEVVVGLTGTDSKGREIILYCALEEDDKWDSTTRLHQLECKGVEFYDPDSALYECLGEIVDLVRVGETTFGIMSVYHLGDKSFPMY